MRCSGHTAPSGTAASCHVLREGATLPTSVFLCLFMLLLRVVDLSGLGGVVGEK